MPNPSKQTNPLDYPAYVRGLRPALQESLGQYVDDELEKLQNSIDNMAVASDGNAQAKVDTFVETYVTDQEAVATRIDTVEASLATEVAALEASITDETTARVTADSALASRVTILEAEYEATGATEGYVTAKVAEEASARAAADGALSTRVSAIEADFTTSGEVSTAVAAAVASEASARATAIAAEATARNTLEATLRGEQQRAALPSTFENALRDFTAQYLGDETAPDLPSSAYSTVTVAGEGAVLQAFSGNCQFVTKAFLKCIPGHTYRIYLRARQSVNSSNSNDHLYVALLPYDQAKTYASTDLGTLIPSGTKGTTHASDSHVSTSNGWVVIGKEWTAPANTPHVYLRPYAVLNWQGNTGTAQASDFWVEDVTDAVRLDARISSEESARASADAAEALTRNSLIAEVRKGQNQGGAGFTSDFARQGKEWTYDIPNILIDAPDLVPVPGAVSFGVSSNLPVLGTITPVAWITSKKYLTLAPGRSYLAEAVGMWGGGVLGGTTYVGLGCYNASGVFLGHYYTYASATHLPGLTRLGGSCTYDQLRSSYPTAAYVAVAILGGHAATGAGFYWTEASLREVSITEGLKASITSEQSARIAADTANTNSITTLSSTVGGHTSTLTTHASTLATLEGHTETRLVTTAVAGSGRAQVAIYAEDNGGGGVDITGDVAIHGNLVVDGSIVAAKIQDDAGVDLSTVVPGSLNWRVSFVESTDYGPATSFDSGIVAISGTGSVTTSTIVTATEMVQISYSGGGGSVDTNGDGIIDTVVDGDVKFEIYYRINGGSWTYSGIAQTFSGPGTVSWNSAPQTGNKFSPSSAGTMQLGWRVVAPINGTHGATRACYERSAKIEVVNWK